MIFSTIDIGTNTILMVTVRADAIGDITVLGDEHGIARLGKGVDASRTILPAAIERLEGFLVRYRDIALGLGSERIVAFGTSALRDASNRQEVIAAMAHRTGITIEIISGEEEARLTYRGALFQLPVQSDSIAVLDIGGGSTEIAYGNGKDLEQGISLDVGAVRITERFLPQLPASEAQIAEARGMVREALDRSFELLPGSTVVGVAGTVTTLGAIESGIERFDAEALNGTWLSASAIASTLDRLSRLSTAEIAAIPQVSSGRADILLGGTIVLDEFMRRHALDKIMVSTRGVRFGMMLREVENMRAAGNI